MSNRRSLIATAAFAVAGLASSAASANLILNGSFEADVIGGANAASGFEYVSTMTNWTVFSPQNGAVLFNASYAPGNLQGVGSGAQSVQLEYAGNYIEQSISTVIGRQYLLKFDLASYDPPGTSTLQVEIGANPALLYGDAGLSAYTTYSTVFTATSTSTLIQFESVGIAGGFTYPHLDDISVEAIPEPASLALFGAALAGLAVARRRRPA